MDVFGNGRTAIKASFARYVAGMSTALVDAGSAGGRQASFSWFYQGPAVNTGSGPYVTADKALQTLWDWFFANGGTALVIHAKPDDMKTDPAGNAGDRIACALVTK